MKFLTTTIVSLLFSVAALAAAPEMLKLSGTVKMSKISYDMDIKAALKKETDSKVKYVATVVLKNNQGTTSYTKIPLTLKKKGRVYNLAMAVTTKSGIDFEQRLSLAGKMPALEGIHGLGFELDAKMTESQFINLPPGVDWEHNHEWITRVVDEGSAQLFVIE